MKNILSCLFFVFISTNAFSFDPISIQHSMYNHTEIVFYPNKLSVEKLIYNDWPVKRETLVELKGRMSYDSGLIFFIIQDPVSKIFNGFSNVLINHYIESNNPILILYNQEYSFGLLIDTSARILNTQKSPSYFTELGTKLEFSASSYLIENEISYSPDNLSIENPCIPWVDGKTTAGIGEIIQMTNNKEFDRIIVSNGYVSARKPYLYTANSRVKKVHISDKNSGIDFDYILEDTPQFQVIKLPEKTISLSIRILSIYEGAKWPNDTCLNILSPLARIPDGR